MKKIFLILIFLLISSTVHANKILKSGFITKSAKVKEGFVVEDPKIKLSLFLIMVKTQMIRQKRVNVFGQWI